MKDFSIQLPIKPKGRSVSTGIHNNLWYFRTAHQTFYVMLPPKFLAVLFLMLMFIAILLLSNMAGAEKSDLKMVKSELKLDSSAKTEKQKAEIFTLGQHDVIGYFLETVNLTGKRANSKAAYREQFLLQKHLLSTRYLIQAKASRIDQLSEEKLKAFHGELTSLYFQSVFNQLNLETHVVDYFSDSSQINVIATALMEQAKFHIPASITLAQSALETAYGQRVIGNNYFGIKDKSGKTSPITTTEYYNETEIRRNHDKILSKTLISFKGKKMYRCLVKDSFAEYATPWRSFRAHSEFLAKQNRYAPLFTHGKDYQAWADKIGSSKNGGVGYATSPLYGELLKKIIKRYHLDLLDF